MIRIRKKTKLYILKYMMSESDKININVSDDIENREVISDMRGDREREIRESLKVENYYPDQEDEDIQYKLYNKREFYIHKKDERPEININNYEEIRDYRERICRPSTFQTSSHQSLLANMINPETPYRGLLIFHGLGTGKCVHPETILRVNNKERRIKELWDENIMKIYVDEENGQWKDVENNNYKIISYMEEEGDMRESKISKLYREYYYGKLRRVILEDKKEIIMTYKHKLFKGYWSEELSIGDEVRVITESNIVCISKIERIEEIDYNGYIYDLEVLEYHNYVGNNIICHNTCTAITIAERFKEQVKKYNTKIYVIVPGPSIKENWKREILSCTGETYMRYVDNVIELDEEERERMRKDSLILVNEYYRFMSYKGFYRRVLGEKIADKVITKDEKTKVIYRKTDEGEFERDVSVDKIYNLNNSLLILDEAHYLTGNNYGEALRKIIENSINLKILLLTATPMKNQGSDIVELLNYLRPIKYQIERERIFTSDKIDKIEIKDGGIEYLKKMASGYVSHVRGADPLTYAKRIDKGEIGEDMLFTKVIRCKMSEFQRSVYETISHIVEEDTLDRSSGAVANFVFPSLNNKKELIGEYGNEGINKVKNQLISNVNLLNKKISELLGRESKSYIYLSSDEKRILGDIFKKENLEIFSTKFYRALKKLNRLVWGKKGAKTAFIYCNLVKVGIDIFQEILNHNGYLEYEDNYENYQIKDETICYYCGMTHKEHLTNKIYDYGIDKEKDASTDYEEYKKHIKTEKIPKHVFMPATYIVVKGQSTDEYEEVGQEEKQRIIDKVFNNIENKEGKLIKLVLGSKVMNEGISLKNCSEVHILDVYYNLGKVDQTIGRAIRYCSHYDITTEENPFPFVNVYKYVISLEKGLSPEEELYQKAEKKYLLVKQVERALKEIAIDCPLNINGNIFKEEVREFSNCKSLDVKGNLSEKIRDEKNICPVQCDFTNCEYKCENLLLNNKYYDPESKIYKKIRKENLDMTTFTNTLARTEIDYCKRKIKEMYIKNYVYTIKDFITYITESYSKDKRDLFDNFFIYKALDELIPITENDFNNFKDTIIDKYNRQGYLIYRGKYYLFQPIDQNEDVPVEYRIRYNKNIPSKLSLSNYIKSNDKFINVEEKEEKEDKDDELKKGIYDFESVLDYYDNRDEFTYVGIIDKERIKGKENENNDIFKIREKRRKVLDKKRGTGIPSLKGAVCFNAKNKEYIRNVAKKLNVIYEKNDTRLDICNKIKDKMLDLEKYSTTKDKNKMTYVMIPKNHPIYPFPYNLEDRVEFIKSNIKDNIKYKLDIQTKLNNKKYEIIIKDSKELNEYVSFLNSINAIKNKNEWIITIK